MKYLITYGGTDATMLLEYGEDGFITAWTITGTWDAEFWRSIWKRPPYRAFVLETWKEVAAVNTKVVPEDLSFGTFWEAYKYKVGNKKQAEKLWGLLPEVDKIAAMAAVPKYLYWLACRPNMEQTHATTWLNQRRWENDYRK